MQRYLSGQDSEQGDVEGGAARMGSARGWDLRWVKSWAAGVGGLRKKLGGLASKGGKNTPKRL